MPFFWHRRGAGNIALLPLSVLFALICAARRRVLLARRPAYPLPPIIIVGNLAVGGGGKTPVVIALASALMQHGWRPGILCSGYGGAQKNARLVQPTDPWQECGDEALLLAKKTRMPCAAGAGRQRVLAARLLAQAGCNVIISDDGLQRYDLPRAIEIAVFDGGTGLGNGWRLPAGPLRESPARAQQCHFRLISRTAGAENPAVIAHLRRRLPAPVHEAHRALASFYQLCAPQKPLDAAFFAGRQVAAAAAVAHPRNFFAALRHKKIALSQTISLPDHAALDAALAACPADIILLTEKDAIKCNPQDPRLVAARLHCRLPSDLVAKIETRLLPPSA